MCAGFMGGQGAKAGSIAYDESISPTLRATASGSNQVPDVVYDALDCRNMRGYEEYSGTLQANADRRCIVRRLTPLECCRLQGYPDGWTENLAITKPTEEQIDFFVEVWARWAAINGTKPKSRKQVIKWLQDPQSDRAEYKAYGNSLAIPCSSDVLGKIARAIRMEDTDGSQTD